ncbi:MAG: hypothetical protein GF309_06740 [Candidatus Lokiarchaeota archaeon]|nr:hypothetical protein [Candidatus Lokiarchaeota archaeon]
MAQTRPAYNPKYIEDDGTCPHWERDEQFLLDFPDVAEQYLEDIERDGKICAPCLWYEVDMTGRIVCEFTELEEYE